MQKRVHFRDNIWDRIWNTTWEQNRNRTREGGGGGGIPLKRQKNGCKLQKCLKQSPLHELKIYLLCAPAYAGAPTNEVDGSIKGRETYSRWVGQEPV